MGYWGGLVVAALMGRQAGVTVWWAGMAVWGADGDV